MLDSFFGGIFGTICRPLQHLFATLLLYITLMLALPIKIAQKMYELSGFSLFGPSRPSIIAATLGTVLVTPMALVGVTLLASFAIVGSVLLSPFVGLYRGLTKGMKGAFESTWLSTGLFDTLKSLFPSRVPSLPARARVHHQYNQDNLQVVHVRAVEAPRVEQPVIRNNVREQAVIVQAEAPIQVRAPRNHLDNAQHFNQGEIAREERDLAEAMRVSFEDYHRNQNSFGNLARRVVNLYRAPNDITTYVNSLAEKCNTLNPNPQEKLTFFTSDELNNLADMKEDDIQGSLKEYNAILENYTCPFSMSSLNEMSDPITVEVKLPSESKNENSSPNVQRYFYEHAEFITFINTSALNRSVPEIPIIRPNKFENLEMKENNNFLSGINSLNAEIKIYRGIDTATYDLLNKNIIHLRAALNKNQENQQAENTQLARSSSATVISVLPKNENSVSTKNKKPEQPPSPRTAKRNKQLFAAEARLNKNLQANDVNANSSKPTTAARSFN